MKLLIAWVGILAAAWAVAAPAPAAFRVKLEAGKHDRANTPVRVLVALPTALAGTRCVSLTGAAGDPLVGQLTAPELLAAPGDAPAGKVWRELHFILPKLKADEALTLAATPMANPPAGAAGFAWQEKPGEHAELRLGERPVLRYMCRPLDNANRAETYKVFHHLFNPAGTRLVTKGPGGQFTHHRGIFYGFNRVTYGENKKVDIWHCSGQTHQAHDRVIAQETGPVVGRHRLVINWHGVGAELFAREERELTVYTLPGGTFVEFASHLVSAGEKIRLDGDPQHAGFHFRADNQVSEKTKAQTYYLRPDGKGKPGETRNWPGQKTHANLPFDAMSFVLDDQRYTVAYLDRPENPKEARFSERDYGRFGSYFEYDLEPGKALDVRYRLWLQEGEMTLPGVVALSTDFTEPIKMTVE